jgi:hypothetical protein
MENYNFARGSAWVLNLVFDIREEQRLRGFER